MSENTAEVVTGGVVLAAAIGFFLFAGEITGFSGGGSSSYRLSASFRSAEGVSVGTDVRLAGVKVGSVAGLELNSTTFRADAWLTIAEGIELPEDTAAVISSEGLLGGNFVELLPGGSPFNIEPGAEIEDTQGAVSLINLMLKFASGGSEE
ncbi:outer membrane lipid asymmetry maintenance protein MlaD [Candidatus Halocynthiibacter alkanivorans]|jgi:phospholipid/cholesterol/gamma-HCH transport system substrate-binding protein|uniref:outer membrane lipid asymmetry maintenance protein MlaD n=1 Tax=Candidatus Halocynthiibacter alkanivorans TaxID=2267619 RepID=UPI000DF24065|nr:outer membrane lipid asymmetry maintenance protein MlaD [Candidatus Halocynthiibacter alkanivorans]